MFANRAMANRQRELPNSEFRRLTYDQQIQYLEGFIDESDSESDNEKDISEDEDQNEHLTPQRLNDDELSDVEDVFYDPYLKIEIDDDNDIDDEVENEESETTVDSTESVFVAKDKTIWKKTPPATGRITSHNVIRHKFGPIAATKDLSVVDTFRHIFSEAMCDLIIRETNRNANSVYNKWNETNPEKRSRKWKILSAVEFDGYMGILITAGVRHSNTEHVRELWKSDAYPLFRATLSLRRFYDITRFIRFDNTNTRLERLLLDKTAAINDLWLMLNSNLSTKYVPGDCLTVDEQLFPFRGRTRFTQYIPSKPTKYGIKIWWICDAQTSYPITGQIYTGKAFSGQKVNKGERVVVDLCHQFQNSGRNITMSKFFTTLPLARLLMSWELSIVGTLKRNEPYIPLEIKSTKNKEQFTSVFGFSEEDGKLSMCSYVPKKEQNVVLLSTMHYNADVSGVKSKPEMLNYYNQTKDGVVNMDKMLTHFTTKRKTLRWSMAMFYNMIDVAGLAAYIIYCKNHPQITKQTHRRRIFLQDLGKQLAMPAIQERSKNPSVVKHFATRLGIESMLGFSIVPVQTATLSDPTTKDKTGRIKVTGRCYVCRSEAARQRPTRKSCMICSRPICSEHSETFAKCSTCVFEK